MNVVPLRKRVWWEFRCRLRLHNESHDRTYQHRGRWCFWCGKDL